jgi:hypothetical protein
MLYILDIPTFVYDELCTPRYEYSRTRILPRPADLLTPADPLPTAGLHASMTAAASSLCKRRRNSGLTHGAAGWHGWQAGPRQRPGPRQPGSQSRQRCRMQGQGQPGVAGCGRWLWAERFTGHTGCRQLHCGSRSRYDGATARIAPSWRRHSPLPPPPPHGATARRVRWAWRPAARSGSSAGGARR